MRSDAVIGSPGGSPSIDFSTSPASKPAFAAGESSCTPTIGPNCMAIPNERVGRGLDLGREFAHLMAPPASIDVRRPTIGSLLSENSVKAPMTSR